MKRFLMIMTFLFMILMVDGQVNLGTVYFQNPQYLISFEKVMYPGYNIVLENLTVREYLMNTKISEKVLAKKIEEPYDEGLGYFLSEVVFENWVLSASITLNEKYEISEETYELGLLNADLSLSPIISKTAIFMRAKDKQVEEVQIENYFDIQTNKISSNEKILNTRPIKPDEVSDINGNVYRTVKIGEQRWMAENLRATSFSNGDLIPSLNESQWANTASSGLIKTVSDGNFYNFYTLIDERNVCPTGFHKPETWDIQYLYNEITPYGGRTKIGVNKVKQRVYPSLLTPILGPISIGLNSVLYSASAAVDLSYTLPWAIVDGLVLGPIFGWETVKRQKQKVYEKARKLSNNIDTNGFVVEVNEDGLIEFVEGKVIQVPKKYWDKFMMIKMIEGLKVDIIDPNEIQKYKTQANESVFKLKYNAFPTAMDHIQFFVTQAVADAIGLIPILPYREVTAWSYPESKEKKTKSLRGYRYQPVITFLLEKGKEEEFSNPYGFSLNFDNTIEFPGKSRMKWMKNGVGITYDDGGYPQFWGVDIGFKQGNGHELRSFPSVEDVNASKKMSTRIRCVSNEMDSNDGRKD
jgi:hypothetical protein